MDTRLYFLLALVQFFTAGGLPAEENPDPFAEAERLERETETQSNGLLAPRAIEALTERVKPSIVTVRQIGRDGDRRGIGSGFVVGAEGLIATNFHVIGESRPIEIEFPDGAVFPVTGIHSWDRHFDLAVLEIDPGDRSLRPLPLGDSAELRQGQIITAFGAPLGLKFSVVSGVISAIRELDSDFLGEETPDYPMIQVAMPIEMGNSGGPLVSLEGRVMGVVTLRHRLKENLGFAVRSNDLGALLAKPNPVPMERWKTIGALDPGRWTILMDGDWKQRGGMILAEAPGSGFGGRTLCLSAEQIPEDAYEVAVQVRLDDESGAAGLVFSSDGGDRHYGFYPSGGQMRLTRFEGPDVYSWSILEQVQVDAYEPGEWNRLRVRIDGESIRGFVNGVEVLALSEPDLAGGRAGLCKFRDTRAEFREFRIGNDLAPVSLTADQIEAWNRGVEAFIEERDAESFLRDVAPGAVEGGREFLLGKAREFEELAAQLRELESALHQQSVAEELGKAIDRDEDEIDLFEVALQLARVDDPQLDCDHYRGVFARLVADAGDYVGDDEGIRGVRSLRDFLFRENGFHGSRNEYYHHANSYINRVLDDREGLPITLSVLFIEMARRLGLDGVFGVALPGQFLVGYRGEADDDLLLFNVFEEGEEMTRADAERLAASFGSAAGDETFQPAASIDIASRMLRNLIGLEINQRENPPGALGYLNLLLAIDPESVHERFQRALIQVQTNDFEGAKKDIDWLLERRPGGINHNRLMRFREALP